MDFSQIVIECVKPEIVTGNPVACGVLGLETYGGLSFDDREFKGASNPQPIGFSGILLAKRQ
ncbi:hypothetical protein, partial [Paraprevotella clara]|uniref:hypothetical protein n=1 Tax=Paraprevotella clara TaxID=454154 RepID=UPI0040282F8A